MKVSDAVLKGRLYRAFVGTTAGHEPLPPFIHAPSKKLIFGGGLEVGCLGVAMREISKVC